MKNIMSTVLILFLTSNVVSAEKFVFLEQYTTVQRGNSQSTVPQLNLSIEKDFHEGGRFGYFSWSQMDKNYQEMYAGITYRPTKWLKVGGGGGLDNSPNVGLWATYAYATKDKNSLLGILNKGTDRWYQLLYNRSIGKRFGLGVMSQESLGTGPRGEVKVGPVKIWGTAFLKTDQHNFIFGIRYEYFKP